MGFSTWGFGVPSLTNHNHSNSAFKWSIWSTVGENFKLNFWGHRSVCDTRNSNVHFTFRLRYSPRGWYVTWEQGQHLLTIHSSWTQSFQLKSSQIPLLEMRTLSLSCSNSNPSHQHQERSMGWMSCTRHSKGLSLPQQSPPSWPGCILSELPA